MKGLGLGGAERLTVSCVRDIARDRFSLEVAYVLPWKDALVEDLQQEGIPVHCLGRARARLNWVQALRRLLHEGAYDVVHTHSPLPAVAVRLLGSRHAAVLIHTEHNVWSRYGLPTRLTNALTYSRNDHVIAVSEGVRASVHAPAWLPRRRLPPVETLHHGIDLATACWGEDARRAARARLGLPLHTPVIGSVANFTPKKDQATLLAAFSGLADTYPSLRLVLVGTGPLQPQLERQAAALGLHERIAFLGSRDDVPELLPAFDVFVLSSLHEGLPIALIEAMASAVASVATAVGGVPEVITHGEDGYIVPPGDPLALATALDKLLADPAERERVGASGRQRAQSFGISPAARRMEALYDQLLGDTP
jgi:glycosyltransferase involved in cell wall biosynthesis